MAIVAVNVVEVVHACILCSAVQGGFLPLLAYQRSGLATTLTSCGGVLSLLLCWLNCI